MDLDVISPIRSGDQRSVGVDNRFASLHVEGGNDSDDEGGWCGGMVEEVVTMGIVMSASEGGGRWKWWSLPPRVSHAR